MYRDDDDFYLTSGTDGSDDKPNKLFSPQPQDFEDDDDNESTVVMSNRQVSKLQQIARDTEQGSKRPQQAVKKTMIGMPVVFPKKGGPGPVVQEQRPTPQRPQRVVRPTVEGASSSIVVSPAATQQKQPIKPIVGKKREEAPMPVTPPMDDLPQLKAKTPQATPAVPTLGPNYSFGDGGGERTLVMDAPPDFDALLKQVAATADAGSAPEPTAAMTALTDEMLARAGIVSNKPSAPPTPVLQPSAAPRPTPVQPVVPQLKPLAPTPPQTPQMSQSPLVSPPSFPPAPQPSLHVDATLRPSEAPTMQPIQLPPQLAGLGPQMGGPTAASPGAFGATAGNAVPAYGHGPQTGAPHGHPSGALPYAPQPTAPRAPQAPVPRMGGRAISAERSGPTKSGFIRVMALFALLATAVAWIGPMMIHPDKPKSDKASELVLKKNWPVPVYGDPFANLTNWGEGQLPLVAFAAVMLLMMVLPFPYLLRALLVGGAGTAMFLLATRFTGSEPMLTQIIDAKDTGFYVILGTLILPIGLFMRGHYKNSALARILVVLGMLTVLFVYFGVHFISEGFNDKFVILSLIESVTKGETLAQRLQGGLLILPLLCAVLGVFAFLDKSKSGGCGLWGFLFLASFVGAYVCLTLFGTAAEAKTAAVAPIAQLAWFFATLLAMTLGLGHFFGEIGKKISKPD